MKTQGLPVGQLQQRVCKYIFPVFSSCTAKFHKAPDIEFWIKMTHFLKKNCNILSFFEIYVQIDLFGAI